MYVMVILLALVSTNKPSLFLSVHQSENPDHAEPCSWCDPDAKGIGINLRWMQASCSID